MSCVAPCLKGLCVTVICDTSLAQKLVFYNDFWCLPAWCVSLRRNEAPRGRPRNRLIVVAECKTRSAAIPYKHTVKARIAGGGFPALLKKPIGKQ